MGPHQYGISPFGESVERIVTIDRSGAPEFHYVRHPPMPPVYEKDVSPGERPVSGPISGRDRELSDEGWLER